VAPDSLIELVSPGYRKDLQLVFELIVPVAGVYTFGVTGPDTPTVTQEIAIP
jgi:hypothetical protein